MNRRTRNWYTPCVDIPVDELHQLVDLGAVASRIAVQRPVAVAGRPLRREVQRDLRVVVRDHLLGRDVHHRRHGDTSVVAGIAREVPLLQPFEVEDRIAAASIEVERPAALVVHRRAHAHRQHWFEPEEPPHDDGPVGPRTRPGHDQPVAAQHHGPAETTVGRDAIGEVVGVGLERATRLDVAARRCLRGHGRSLPGSSTRHTSFIASLAATATGSHTDEKGGA